MCKLKVDLIDKINSAIDNNKAISIVTYYLSDYGEKVLNTVSETILSRFNRPDLNDIVYTSIKELVINATKANLKRILFQDFQLDPREPGDYKKVMQVFKENLSEEKMRGFKNKLKTNNLPVTITFYYEPHLVLRIKIKNNHTLLPQEEERIRDRFKKARKYTNLMEFYMEYGDETEGAGMGITLVEVLLHHIGIDRHMFSIYSSEKYQETIARLEIPLSEQYEDRRSIFERELKESEHSIEEFRKGFTVRKKLD